MASSSAQSGKEYICQHYQRGECQYGKRCRNRHDEQGLNIVPAHRRVTPAMLAKYGPKVLQTEDRW